jgi:LmbE family N-acetylglucosaminyl deacetylase
MDKNVLVLAPHPDDAEISSGGTICRLIQEGYNVHYAVFSPCNKSLPPGFKKNAIYEELKKAVVHLGVDPSNVNTYSFPVREFPAKRQDILEIMIELKQQYNPYLVLTPNSHDIHQDHQTIHNESLRAFKTTCMLGYELPWNNLTLANNFYYKLESNHINCKINAIQEYHSQKFRKYMANDFFLKFAELRGLQVHHKYAEAFELIRWVVE